jgi:hypothetical protein
MEEAMTTPEAGGAASLLSRCNVWQRGSLKGEEVNDSNEDV